MSQFKHLFNTSRLPQQDKDILFHKPDANHVVVIHKGNFYEFDVANEHGEWIHEDCECLHLHTPSVTFPPRKMNIEKETQVHAVHITIAYNLNLFGTSSS